MEDTRSIKRRRFFILLFLTSAMMVILVHRLVLLQFLEYDAFRSQAERNSVRRIAREPIRGLIYDRNMKVIVDNHPSYTLTLTPFEFRWSSLPLLCTLFQLDSNFVKYRVLHEAGTSFEPVKIARDLTFDMLAKLEENRDQLPGVNYAVENRREYKTNANFAHVLGYIKEISPGLINKLGEYYRPGDIVGYNGVESFYEPVLRGRKGYGFYTVDSRGKVVESFEHGKGDIPAMEGSDVILTIDSKFQAYCEALMRNRRGALVALDPSNGEVLSYVSSPTYSLADISGRITPETWRALVGDPGHPLYDRVSMAAYPPGSTFKMMLGAAALEEHIIDESSTINCPGSYTLAGVTFKCHGAHGNINVVRAIEYSCNVFFYKLIFKLGFDRWAHYGNAFHFGRLTGIDIANERPGVLPTEAYYNRRYGKRWNKGYLVSLGIGQGEVNTTPMQMASYTATIANSGLFVTPHVVKATVNRAERDVRTVTPRTETLPISERTWSIIQAGMYRVVQGSGTGNSARIANTQVAGKTGTAQNPHGRDHAWFIGYAPFRSPKIAIAVIIENGGFGGMTAAPVAASAMNFYLNGSARSDSAVTTPRYMRQQQAALRSLAD